MRKAGSPWTEVRLRQAVNYAINREDLIRYATKGNGVIIPTLIPALGFGFDPTLAPYPFAPDQARHLLREAGYPEGLALTLIAPPALEMQATVVSKMLEHAGFQVARQILAPDAYNRKVVLSHLEQPPAHQTWDIALASRGERSNFSPYLYHFLALDGILDWVIEQPELRQLYEQGLRTVDTEQQQALLHRMERHTRD
jgi:ABC-type transport system substrate-binding protein